MKTPKLLINLNILRIPLTGIGHYTLNIVKQLLERDIELVGIHQGRILSREAIVAIVAEMQSSPATVFQSKLKRHLVTLIRAIPGAYQVKFWLQSLKLKPKLSRLAVAGYVYFEPCFVPFAYAGRTVTTVHDLSFIIHPEYHPPARVKYLQSQLINSISQSNILLVDSHSVLAELHRYYPASIDKSDILYLGVNNQFKPHTASETATLLQQFGLGYRAFLLSVATLEPRKNLLRLVQAYAALPQALRARFPLVLVGDKGWQNDALWQQLNELSIQKQIIITGYLPDESLQKLYASAALFAYPSLYEGFGLPIIEAMASGTAVITSDYGAMAEVAGEAAFLVDPYSIESLNNAMMTLLNNEELRADLVEAGLKRAKKFTWQQTVDKLIAIAAK